MIEHIFQIPFCYRRSNFASEKMPDPLRPKVLDKRIKFLEMFALASLKAQDNQNFKVIIVIDPLLPQKYRDRLKEISRELQQVYFHEFSKSLGTHDQDYLKQYVDKGAEYLTITYLDDDDALFKGFTAYVYRYLSNLNVSGNIQPLHILKCNNVWQWDFFYSRNAPLGYIKPWSRKNTITNHSGLTVCQKFPELWFLITTFGHKTPGFLFEDINQFDLKQQEIHRVNKLKDLIQKKAHESALKWDGKVTRQLNYHEIQTDSPQLLMTNNLLNDRYVRMFEAIENREVFDGLDSLPGFGIDYELARKQIKQNRKTISLLLRMIWKSLFVMNWVNKKSNRIFIAKKTLEGILNLK